MHFLATEKYIVIKRNLTGQKEISQGEIKEFSSYKKEVF